MANKKYLVNVGIDWYGGNRAEAGDVRDDIPTKSIPWLLKRGVIEPYDPKAEKAKAGAGATPAAESLGDTTETPGENAEAATAGEG